MKSVFSNTNMTEQEKRACVLGELAGFVEGGLMEVMHKASESCPDGESWYHSSRESANLFLYEVLQYVYELAFQAGRADMLREQEIARIVEATTP